MPAAWVARPWAVVMVDSIVRNTYCRLGCQAVGSRNGRYCIVRNTSFHRSEVNFVCYGSVGRNGFQQYLVTCSMKCQDIVRLQCYTGTRVDSWLADVVTKTPVITHCWRLAKRCSHLGPVVSYCKTLHNFVDFRQVTIRPNEGTNKLTDEQRMVLFFLRLAH